MKKWRGWIARSFILPADFAIAMGVYFIVVAFFLGGQADFEKSMLGFGFFCGLVYFQIISNFWFRESRGFFYWVWLIVGVLAIAMMAIGALTAHEGGLGSSVVYLISVPAGWFAGLGLRKIWWSMFGAPEVHHGHH